jgi:hypothetical protein
LENQRTSRRERHWRYGFRHIDDPRHTPEKLKRNNYSSRMVYGETHDGSGVGRARSLPFGFRSISRRRRVPPTRGTTVALNFIVY